MQSDCQPFTALFDIRRSAVDGRSIESYRTWLSATLRTFPDLVVYHDGCCDSLAGDDPRFVRIPLESLSVYSLLPAVERVLATFKPAAPNDLTFRHPLYSLILCAKVELAAHLKATSRTRSLLWIDAGASRFLPEGGDFLASAIQESARRLLRQGYDFAAEVDLRTNFSRRTWAVRPAYYGTCRRIFSGTGFWLRSDCVAKVHADLRLLWQELLDAGVWDNEQVVWRNYIPVSGLVTRFVLQTDDRPGVLLREFLRPLRRSPKLFHTVLQRRMVRDVHDPRKRSGE